MDEARFWAKVEKTDTCWLWIACTKQRSGYGRIRWAGRMQYAHRVAYELCVGPVPADKQLDHLCRVRHCVNPAHLEPVTARENTLRGESLTARFAQRDYCAHGHLLTEQNIVRRKAFPNVRQCKECTRDSARRWRESRKKAA